MVRDYKRKTYKGCDGGRYTKAQLQAALDDVANRNKTVYGACAFYNIPRTTLRHYMNGSRGSGVFSKEGKGGGGRYALGLEAERKLATLLGTMQKWGYGLSRSEVLDLVQNYVKSNKIKTKFKNDRPGDEWFINFCSRNKLSIKKPQGVEVSRKKQENPWAIYGSFDLLEKTIADLHLEGKANQIFNCDETSFSSDPSKTKIVGPVGTKCTRTISTCGRENTTVLVCCSASGNKLPLLTIFKGKNVMESWLPNNPEPNDKTGYAASQRGWMVSSIFVKWFKKCFLLNAPKERPLLLILDGHATHISCELIDVAIQNQVFILKLPPHSTHILQPLDVGVFKSMKTRWDQALCKWQRSNPRKKIAKNLFVELLNTEYNDMPNINIINAFKATGIYNTSTNGADRTQISKTIFSKSDLAKYDAQTIPRENNELDIEIEPEPSLDPEANIHRVPGELEQPQPSTSSANVNDTSTQEENENILPESSKEVELEGSSPSTNTTHTSFEALLSSLLKRNAASSSGEIQTKRRRICSSAELITTPEYLNRKKEEERLQKEKEDKKIQRKQARTKNTKNKSDTDLEISALGESALEKRLEDPTWKGKSKAPQVLKKKKVPVPPSSDSESSEDDLVLSSEEDAENPIAVVEGDYILVMYNSEPYPGRVLSVNENKVEIVHMEKSGLFSWRWPKKTDKLTYDESEIIQIIQKPQEQNKRGACVIPEMKRYSNYKT